MIDLPPGYCKICAAKDGIMRSPRRAWLEAGGSHWLYFLRCERCKSIERRALCLLEALPKSLAELQGQRPISRASGYVD